MKSYPIVVERTDTGFSAYAPDLSGCVATGRSVGDVMDRMEEAIELHVQGLREDGDPVPEPSLVAVVEVDA